MKNIYPKRSETLFGLKRLIEAVCDGGGTLSVVLGGDRKKAGEICARLTDSLNVWGQGSAPPLTPQDIDREKRYAKSFLSY